MPFTAAHPLAVVPLVCGARWLRLDATCLVIGSMAPDVEYFARAAQISTISHTLRGLWLWNLPVTLVLAALLHGLVRWPLLLVAPAAITRRVLPVATRTWRVAAIIACVGSCAISALIGAASHLAWDGLTHADGFGPTHLPALRAPITLPVIGTLTGPMITHRALQHASTVLGLVVLAALTARWWLRRPPVVLPAVPRAAARCVLVACVISGVALVWRAARSPIGAPMELGQLVVVGIAGTLAGVLVASIALAPRARRFQRAVAGVTTTSIV